MFRAKRQDAVEQLDQYEARSAKASKGDKHDQGETLLKVLTAQKGRSIGFENDKELNAERADALDYYKGKPEGAIKRDLPTLANRSTVVSTDVANGVETALPDIIEVFTAGPDTLAFKPIGAEDVEQAKQETDYTRHIVFQQNRGWMLLYTGFKDALISKTGIFHFHWDSETDYEEYTTTASEPQIEEIEEQGGEVMEVEPTNAVSMHGFPMFKVTFRKPCSDGHVVICNVPPEDFTVSPETVTLADSEYCAMRTRVSRQALIDQGYDEDDVMRLDATEDDDDEKQARDLAEENNDVSDPGMRALDLVDIITHYIRIDLDGSGRRQIWRVVTGNDESIELEREKRSMIEFAAITPFPMPHRFYGQSLADKLITIQKWKTSVTRQANDHLYFANNQRQEVKKAGIVAGVTMEQLVDNSPGQPVVTEDGNSLRPLQNGSLGVDVLGLLEYINTDSEGRSGIVRNAQGIAPDTMHETAEGSKNLLNVSQKRARMMARLFAETGLRDLFLGVHDLARQNATLEDTVQLRGKWVPVSPSQWRRRKDMEIDIGVGSGGTEDDMLRLREWRGALAQTIEAQGGIDAKDPLVTRDNIYSGLMTYGDKLRIKNAQEMVTNPADLAQQKAMSGETDEPEVPPEVMQAQMELKIEQETQAARIQLETEKAKTKAQIDMAIAKENAALRRQELESELELERMRAAAKLQIERESAAAKLEITREEAALKAQLARDSAQFEADLAEQNSEREYKLELKKASWKAETDHESAMQKTRPGGDLSK